MIDIQRICKKSGTKIKKENIENDKNKREEKKERLAGSRKRKKKQNSLSVLVLHPNVIGQINIHPAQRRRAEALGWIAILQPARCIAHASVDCICIRI